VSGSPFPTLLVATSNPGKLAEFVRILPTGVRVVDLAKLGVQLPPETGTSFAENAATKAIAAAEQSGLISLADDSGLVVDALGGAPGVLSARFAGGDEANRRTLLAALARVPRQRRTARFVCAVALARPETGTIVARAEGTCEGMIAAAPRGSFGFGYDPVFELPDGRTMAELAPEEKDKVSHRGVAYRRILPALLAELTAEPAREGHRR
jgi:XTP/dITP diphosphohydrolase